jgi:UDP-N-acetylglucosamine transferase subunit ALG13
MIVVTVGASRFPFDRLLRAVEALGAHEGLVVQHGPSQVRPSHASCQPFMSFDELRSHMRSARVVVSHAGVGSMLVALACGKRPYVVPRRREFGETVDDHQLESARRFAQAGMVTLVEDPSQLAEAVDGEGDPRANTFERPHEDDRLAMDLRAYFASVVGPPTALEELAGR